MSKVGFQGRLLARNTLLNLVGQATPLFVSVITIPFFIRGLGVERFGLLSLAWVVLGYFSLFDLGLGRAATKFVAEALGKGETDRLPHIVWTTTVVQMALGVLGGTVLAMIVPLLVAHLLRIPTGLLSEASATFYILAASVPILLISASWRGVLEAGQRFDLVNLVKVPSSVASFLLPLAGVLLGLELPGIVALSVGAMVIALVGYMFLCFKVVPALRTTVSIRRNLLRPLLSFGGWITLSDVVTPIFVYADRFLVGSLMTLSAVAYYATPYDMASKLLIIPASLASVLFPAFSTLASDGDRDRLSANAMRSVKYLATAMLPFVVLLFVFAEDILRIWLGVDFAKESTTVFRLLTVAVLANAIGYVPYALIQGVGRPDVIAKYLLIELPLYAVVTFLLIGWLGINGAALAWCLRMGWAIPIFSVLCLKVAGVPLKTFSDNGTIVSLVAGTVLLLLTSVPFFLGSNWGLTANGLLASTLLMGYVAIIWRFAFDQADKRFLKEVFHRHG